MGGFIIFYSLKSRICILLFFILSSLNFGRNLGGKLGRVKPCDFTDAGTAFTQGRPDCIDADTQRCYETQSGNDNPSAQRFLPFWQP